ncbi:peptide cleavage/export ABC transporter [Companilactobacillus mishanensis]|uniref:Peptide cleavage/export ABC transporter n=1 Tax=Companilactobacillus mishanensis TaxID=2486008 RepID=A0A5P0ZIK7_9LACO|nr:peptide cleavage/export ABC transporter [Companilactobacillus mishanensis]MQS52923.1 peptide cleavage/export ABC transporter [Companilactobacillus mishanensis]
MRVHFMKNYVSQVDENDCGVAALSMIFKSYGSNFSLAKLRSEAKTDKEGTTALGLVRTAEMHNFETEAVKADLSIFDQKDLPAPFIVHVIKKQKLQHYYVVEKFTKKYIIIADPDPTVKIRKMTYSDFSEEWTGVALFIVPSEKYVPQKEKSNSSLVSFIPMLLKQKNIVANIVLASLLTTFISILGSYFLQSIIDDYIPNNLLGTLGMVSIGLIVFYIFQSVFTYGQNFLLAVLGQKLSIDIILGYIKHIFNLPLSFFATRKTGEIVSRFNDASKIIDALASTIISMFLDVGIVIMMGIVLAWQNIDLFLITLLSLPIYVIIIISFAKPFNMLNQQEMESNSVLNSSIIEDIHGIETIKSLTSEDIRYKRIDGQFVDYLRKNLSYTKVDILQQSLKLFLQLILDVVILWNGAVMVTKNQMSLGQLMTFNALLAYFINPLQSIINLQTKLQTAKVANNRLNEVFLVRSEFSHERKLLISELKNKIELKDVSYRYGYGRNVLNCINWTIEKDEKITIVGISGSGKSTLVKLLVNYFEPTSGQITIDGRVLSQLDRKSLRSTIVYTPQDPYVFSGTIEDNLRLGNRIGITRDDIVRACKLAQIYSDIESMPLGFKTLLDENGNTLSGGQKQRITIARSLLSSAKVLIFDESTSGLDTITEKKVVENLTGLSNMTIIFIAHRLAVAEKTDNIVVMDDGKIVESGNHLSLMEKKGFYYKLVNS